MKRAKLALFQSVVALLLCCSMLIGTTFAWFSDSEISAGNIIQTGKLKIGLEWKNDLSDEAETWKDASEGALFNYEFWEPGYTDLKYLKVSNVGNLAFQYQLSILPADAAVGASEASASDAFKLAEAIDVYYAEIDDAMASREDAAAKLTKIGTLSDLITSGLGAVQGILLPTSGSTNVTLPAGVTADKGETTACIMLKMRETAGNEYMGLSAGDGFCVQVLATQYTYENDTFGNNFDTKAAEDELKDMFTGSVGSVSGSAEVDVADGKTTAEVQIGDGEGGATIPAGVQVAEGATELTLTITEKAESDANVTLGAGEALLALDVHIEGVAEDNTVPMVIALGKVLPPYMNLGNVALYHVEDATTAPMTQVSSLDELDAHNEFYYDVNTGNVTIAIATFSEVTLINDTTKAWEGNFDYSWYTNANARTEASEYTIANADQLAAFGAIVGGMNGQTPDSFKGKTVKLLADINLGYGVEGHTYHTFYPIGYYNSTGSYEKTSGGSVTSTVNSFEGTFDGAGHTISNFYQNTWEMFGDYNDGYSGTPNHYKDAMGLFGYVVNGTVKNLTVNNFSSDGEFTPTGVIAAYAVNSTFENIAITNCNPRVYNTGNGGIIGIAGRENEAVEAISLKNITVDNSNIISALWGSYDVACGGLVGMYRGNVDASGEATGDTISFENCHVAAQMDVYNDVCGNYQYYAYRYAGMIIGSIRHNTKNAEGKTIPNMTGISATGCTVNYGTWNDYYYCEFESNGHPSYAGPDDYKFSRVPNDQIDTSKGKENATCIGHKHSDVEDNQAIYLPFHQLFTGYSWGVSSIGLEKYSGIATNLDITEGDDNKSEKKFNAKISDGDTLEEGKAYKFSKLFSAIDPDAIITDAVIIAVTDIDDDDTVTVSATFDTTPEGWENDTVTFTNQGKVKITIQDYHFCTPTELTVIIGAKESITISDRFDYQFPNTDKYLYRVGNQNPISIGSLFKAAEGQEDNIGNITITVADAKVARTQNYVYEPGDKWNSGTIDFTDDFTGPVTITISDDNYSNSLSLDVEVVNATNITELANWNDNTTSVLLNDISLNTVKRITGNKTLYGNGFTIDATGAPYTGVEYDYASYVIYLEDSTLDNVIIEGKVYPELGTDKTQNYNRALVMTNGDCKVTNCYLTNTASPIRNGGNLELIDTTLKGGIYANLDIRNGHTILDGVTTINQFGQDILTSDNKQIVGLGIVVYQEGGTEELKITIRNKLTQHNLISEAQATSFDGNAKTFVNTIFDEPDFSAYRYNDGTTEWVNTGIISMNNYFTKDDLIDERSDNDSYFGTEKEITLLTKSRNCYVYSYTPSSGSNSNLVSPDVGLQGVIPPSAEFDFKTKNYIAKVDGSNDYCVEEYGSVSISMDEGDTFNWDPMILNVTKNGNPLEYTVTMNGTAYTDQKITFKENGTYVVKYSYIDGQNYKLVDGTLKAYDVNYTKELTINVSVVEAAAKNAVFSFGANGTAYTGKTVIIGDKTYVMPDVTETVSGKIGSKTVNGTTVYYPITEMYTSDGTTEHSGSWYACFPIFKDAVQITDYADKGTGDAVLYNQTKVTTVAQIPSTLKATDPKTAFLYSMNATNYPPPTDPTAVSGAVCYTCNRNGLDSGNTRKEENTVAEYTYTDNAGKVYYYYIGYHCAEQTKGSGCVTAGTLITMADGTQKAVENLNVGDMVMAFNHISGKFEAAPIIFNTHSDDADTRVYDVLHLNFSNGKELEIVQSHGLFDMTLMQYVYIDYDNYHDFIGHEFYYAGENGTTGTTAVLKNAYIAQELTRIFCPVSYFHMNSIANGFLNTPNIPGDITGLVNYFEYDEDLKYNEEAMQKDIETYGLYTYADFSDYISEAAYHSSPAVHLKVAVGKGMITFEEILDVIEYLLSGSLIS